MDKFVQACSNVNFGVFPCSPGLKLKVCWIILEFNTTETRTKGRRPLRRCQGRIYSDTEEFYGPKTLKYLNCFKIQRNYFRSATLTLLNRVVAISKLSLLRIQMVSD